jgi:YHS domain-containing protein
MSDINELVARIDNAFTAAKDKVTAAQKQELQLLAQRQKLHEEYQKVQAKIVEIAKPRLQALAKRSGERVSVTPSLSETRRSARFEFKSPKALITLTFSVAPDREIKNAAVDYDIKIIPVLWRFESHSEFSTPVATPDYAALTKWLDDRIVGFVELYIHIHEGEFYDKAEYVEDPIAKVKFPKVVAAASIEHAGKTYFFIDDTTKAEFARQQKITSA